jgi:hypothetical protein
MDGLSENRNKAKNKKKNNKKFPYKRGGKFRLQREKEMRENKKHENMD